MHFRQSSLSLKNFHTLTSGTPTSTACSAASEAEPLVVYYLSFLLVSQDIC